jgi:probable HAF family extracellular repeat protein
MKSRTLTLISAIGLLAAPMLPTQLAAQHIRYKLVDIGTFGGPASYLTDPGNGLSLLVLNNQGVLVGKAATSTPDPNCGDPDCFLAHAFRWENGARTDLGTLSGGNYSAASGVNARGWIVIDGTNGAIDPLTGGPVFRGALWREGQILELPTLGDGLETNALYVNDAGQVVGFGSINTTPDPTGFSFIGGPIHPFIWQNGVMRDLGTLGGPDALPSANCNNQRTNLVTGFSFADSTPNPDTGIPTMHPFLYQDGNMTDLGTLGGTLLGELQCANNSGQVAGASTLAGNSVAHAFLWKDGLMHDLGTLGGDNSSANWLNNAGDVVGTAQLVSGSNLQHAFLWRQGVMTDLGTLGTNSNAFAINSQGQIVGRSRVNATTRHAFLWENGGPMIDLNTLIPPNSSLELEQAENINDLGEIAGRGRPPGCTDEDVCGHAFLLIPCSEIAEGCVDNTQATAAATQNQFDPISASPAISTPTIPTNSGIVGWRARLAQRYHIPGLGASRD